MKTGSPQPALRNPLASFPENTVMPGPATVWRIVAVCPLDPGWPGNVPLLIPGAAYTVGGTRDEQGAGEESPGLVG